MVDFLSKTLAEEVMTREVVCVYPKTGLKELSSIFIENEISGVPVLDDEAKVVGFVTQTDLVELDLHSDDYRESRTEETGGFVQDIMVPDVLFARNTDPLGIIIDKMCTQKIHRLIVLDPSEKIAGIVTTMDVMCYLRKAYQNVE
ncbi:MAG: CBS domain-containing protein [bacterium]|nr:CBS domain-containing protein [bacterium]